MIQAPVRRNPRRQVTATTRSIPAPVGGLNTRDALAEMNPLDAVILDNFFPEDGKVTLRKGSAVHGSGMTGNVDSLMEYANGSTSKLFAAADNSIFDVSTPGAVGAAELSGLTNNRWQHLNFGTPGGRFLVMCNGADAVRNYNGTTWTTPTITGVNSSDLIHVSEHKARLWFIEKDTMNAWFLPVNSIAGAASKFDFSSLTKKGGFLMAMATWSIDGGKGQDDLAIFITSKGEVIVYEGTDPTDAAKWALVGVFSIGAPIGRRCFFNVGSDVILITEDGFVPLSKSLITGRTQPQSAISDKINPSVSSFIRTHGPNFGFQPILYPRGKMAIFNMPLSSAASCQYVMNIVTGAWCRFTGWNANCLTVFNKELYFGSSGKVFKADTGTADDGANITGDVQQAFNYFGSPGRLKQFSMARPILQSNGDIGAAIALNIDFTNKFPSATPTFSGGGAAPWNTSPWNTTAWAQAAQVRKSWQAVNGLGYSAAFRMRIVTNALTVSWLSTDFIFKPGGFI